MIISKKIKKFAGFKHSSRSLSYSQAWALMIIDSQKEISQAEIATRLHLMPASVVTLIDQMEQLKLVIRESPNGDRRKYNLNLTESGKKELNKIKYKILELDKTLKKQLTNKEVTTLHTILDKLFLSIENMKGGENEISGPK